MKARVVGTARRVQSLWRTRMIYLDHNATTPMRPSVIEACTAALRETFGNPSSAHQVGQGVRRVLDSARRDVAALIGATPGEIVFTSGATEANRLAMGGLARAAGGAGAMAILTSPAEHPSACALPRHAVHGAQERRVLALDSRGRIGLSELEAALSAALGVRPAPTLFVLSVMLVQNEVGNVYPLAEMAAIARRYGALVHCDATQAVGRIPVDVDALGVDLLSLSGHKLGGPRGVGALYVRRQIPFAADVVGGHQERGRRPGTENVLGIVGLGAAARDAVLDGIPRWGDVRRRAEALLAGIVEAVPDAQRIGDAEQAIGNTHCVSFRGVRAEDLLMGCDLAGVALSAGSACSSGTLEPSPLLRAMALGEERARSAVRFSVGWSNTDEEIARAVAIVAGEIAHIRSVQGVDMGQGAGRG